MNTVKIQLLELVRNSRNANGTVQFRKTVDENGNLVGTEYYRFRALVLDAAGKPLASVAGKPAEGLVTLNANNVTSHAGLPEFLKATIIEVTLEEFNRSAEAASKSAYAEWMLVFTQFEAETTEEMTDYKLRIAAMVQIEQGKSKEKATTAWRKRVQMEQARGLRPDINATQNTPPVDKTLGGTAGINQKAAEELDKAAAEEPVTAGNAEDEGDPFEQA